MRTTDIPEIGKLSTPEKILFVEELWDDIVNHDSTMAMPQSHQKELNRRLERHLNNPGRLLSLEELQMQVDARK